MNVRHLVPSVSRRLLSMGALIFAAGLQQEKGAGLDGELEILSVAEDFRGNLP